MGYVKIGGMISEEDKKAVKSLVKKGMFSSMSEFYRIAISRFLKELQEYEKERIKRKKKILETEERIKKTMEEIARFADDLF
jgi:Arc/MetJ-type ribon-helix-helix transcriptional regulator